MQLLGLALLMAAPIAADHDSKLDGEAQGALVFSRGDLRHQLYLYNGWVRHSFPSLWQESDSSFPDVNVADIALA
jgi:hypothetical protein